MRLCARFIAYFVSLVLPTKSVYADLNTAVCQIVSLLKWVSNCSTVSFSYLKKMSACHMRRRRRGSSVRPNQVLGSNSVSIYHDFVEESISEMKQHMGFLGSVIWHTLGSGSSPLEAS